MTKAFARLMRSFSDEQLEAMGRERSRPRRPYQRALQTVIDIELDRRRLSIDAQKKASNERTRDDASA